MDITSQILVLLSEKKDIFLEIEEITSSMCILPIEELVVQTDKRGQLLEQVSNIDLQIKAFSSQDAQIMEALNHNCLRDDLTVELGKLFDASLSIKAVVNRILKNEDNIRSYLIMDKQRIADKMEALTRSGESVAGKYHQSVKGGMANTFSPNNNKII